jgi:hypothetical protein
LTKLVSLHLPNFKAGPPKRTALTGEPKKQVKMALKNLFCLIPRLVFVGFWAPKTLQNLNRESLKDFSHQTLFF